MADKTNSPNIFVLLELDPDKPWNQSEFERILQKKRQEWSRLVNLPTKKGIEAKKNLGLITELQRIAKDEGLRLTHAAEARQLREGERADKLRMFEENLPLLQAKGYILEDELKRLVKDFAGILSEQEIRNRLSVPVEKGQSAHRPRREALEPAKAMNIQRRLESLGKSDLYDFLGIGMRTESDQLYKQAQTLYSKVSKKGTKTAEDTFIAELTGFCFDIFKSETERAKYDETVRLQQYDELKKKIDVIGDITKQVNDKQMEQLLREAREKGLDTDETQAIILEYAAKKGYAVIVSGQVAQLVNELLKCGYCGHLNDKLKKHCTSCGELLKEPCPRCGQIVASENTACGACGFPTGNRAWVKVLINDVNHAQRNRDYEAATAYLEQARQAWLSSGSDPIAKQIKELASRIAPAKQEQEALLDQMDVAVQEKRFYFARKLLPRLERVLTPGSHKMVGYRRQIELKIQQAEEKLDQARRAGGSDPEAVVSIFQDALRICQDFQEAREMLAKTPPHPPAVVRATMGGKVIHLTWQPSRSRGVRYTVVRKHHSYPVSVNDGEKLATVAGTVYDDSAAEIGLPLFYAVFADREGVPSREGAKLPKPIMILQDVSNLRRQISNRQVHLLWEAPPNVHDIVVLRSESGYPRSIHDGQRISTLDQQQAIDRQVQNERKYFYKVFCQFKDERGQIRTTSGVQTDAIPQQPPRPITKLHIAASGPPHDRQVQIRWAPPHKGDVVILKSERSTGLESGAVIPKQELSKYGNLLAASSNQTVDRINQSGFYYFVPVIIFQDIAYIGREQQYVCVDDVTNLSVQNLGHTLRLQWQWPPNCQEVLVAYSHENWPHPDQTNRTLVSLSRAQYDLHGYYDILNPIQVDHYIIVFAVITQDGQKIVASGGDKTARKQVSLRSRITIGYEIKKPWLSKKLTLHLTIKGLGTLPALILTRKQATLPMTKSDGEVVFRLDAAPIEDKRLDFALPDESRQQRSYGKLFLEDDELYDVVTIRHPSREKLRLF